MLIEEQHVDAEKGYRLGDESVYEPYTDNIRKLFLAFSKQYGRCSSSIYVNVNGISKKVGWYFEKKTSYQDSPEKYLHGVWITFLKDKDTVTREKHFMFL